MAYTQLSSAPYGDEVNDANSDENYQETELFEDTFVEQWKNRSYTCVPLW